MSSIASKTVLLVLLVAGNATVLPAQTCPSSSTVDVLTHRNNNFRTGANLHETCFSWENVGKIRKLFRFQVDGQVYAQPLVVTHFPITDKVTGSTFTRNVVFIATMKNWIYAYDADGLNQPVGGVRVPYWGHRLNIPSPDGTKQIDALPVPVDRIPWDAGGVLGQLNIEPWVGITSTPVIDRDNKTMFLVAKVAAPAPSSCHQMPSTPDCPVQNWIFAINLRDGTIRHQAQIDLGTPEDYQVDNRTACAAYYLGDKRKLVTTKDDANRIHMQRAALLLTGNAPQLHIYLGFGSHQDAPCPMYHGMMVRFDYDTSTNKLTQYQNTSNPHPFAFFVTRKGETDPPVLLFYHHEDLLGKGGIWQAGNGPASDPQGNVYVMTGNGTYKPGEEFSDNILKLSPDLDQKTAEYFAPPDVKLLTTDVLDVDLGASGPVLVPGTDQVFGGGKQGKLYVVKTTGVDRKLPMLQGFWAAKGWSPSWTHVTIHRIEFYFPISLILPLFATGYHHIHGAPAYWGDSSEANPTGTLQRALFVWPERDNLRSFAYRKEPGQDGKFNVKPAAEGPHAPPGMPGGALSISADGVRNGILWASLPLNEDAWVKIVRGRLVAFRINSDGTGPDGTKLKVAWSSYCTDPHDDFYFAKYAPPTVANSRVYLPTFSGFVNVYGVPETGSGATPDPGCKTPRPARK